MQDGHPQKKPPSADKPARSGPKPPKKVSASWLHNAGLYYLQRFAASSGHFRTVMRRKINRSCAHHPEQDREECYSLLDELIAKFERAGLLDDKIYARGSVISLRRRGLSARAIGAKLQAKGLSSSQIEAAMAEHDSGEHDDSELLAALRAARRKRIGPFETAAKQEIEQQDQKALAALARAGFSYEICRRALDLPRDDAETLLRL